MVVCGELRGNRPCALAVAHPAQHGVVEHHGHDGDVLVTGGHHAVEANAKATAPTTHPPPPGGGERPAWPPMPLARRIPCHPQPLAASIPGYLWSGNDAA